MFPAYHVTVRRYQLLIMSFNAGKLAFALFVLKYVLLRAPACLLRFNTVVGRFGESASQVFRLGFALTDDHFNPDVHKQIVRVSARQSALLG